MVTVAEIQELYDLGKIPEAMSAVWAEVFEERRPDDPEIGRLKVIRAWCHWRRQEWDDARQWLQEAEETGGAERQTKVLRSYFAAYRDKDDATLQGILMRKLAWLWSIFQGKRVQASPISITMQRVSSLLRAGTQEI